MTAAALFATHFGSAPQVVCSAPGRVNLIGEHTDYNGGLVLPFAIDARATVAAAARADGRFRVVSAQRGGPVDEIDADPAPGSITDWRAYLVGAAWALGRTGRPTTGFDLAVESKVPVGAGLSSSAAIECAAVLAMSTLTGVRLDPQELARTAQLDENEFVGVPCGLMDQMASAACRPGSVLFFDIGHDRTEHIPFDPDSAGLATLVIDTRAHHSLADGEYAKRRRTCEQAAAQLGVRSLSEITDLEGALARLTDEVTRRRVRHVVTENERVRRVVDALRAGRIAEIGPELIASHLSLRDDFEVSSPELDLAVQAALSAGALGSRMTGGGFGGSTVNLVPLDLLDPVAESVEQAFADRGYQPPTLRRVSPAAGARVESVGG